ncbi:MAG: hypothetical protein K1060chlam2_01325 [Chlamydiae bacterium]|nr:hypothetical protein [Chlamydiota bacterium]
MGHFRFIATIALSISAYLSADQQLLECDHCELSVRPVHLGVRHIQSGGVGYDKGYSSLDLFITPFSHHESVLFLDLRGHRFTNGKFAANGGLGFRYPYLKRGVIYGANIFYDYRRSNNSSYNQLGMGAEILGRVWSFRANGYLPYGKRVRNRSYSFHRFSGHTLQLKERARRSLAGADAEIEARIFTYRDMKAYLAAGPYFYRGEHSRNASGGKARLTARISDIASLSAVASYDRLFHFNFQGEIGLTFALGKKRRVLKKNSRKRQSRECNFAQQLLEKLDRPVQRNEIIVIGKQRRIFVAKDPFSGAPFHFIHVNNSNSSAGSGSFESPYSTLLSAQNGSKPGDFLYVNAGTRTFIGMNQGITLQNNQKFLGSGMDQLVRTDRGFITLPAMTPGVKPTITNINSLGDGITLANNNRVSGFNISGPLGHGIIASGLSSGSVIQHNDIIDSGGGGGDQAGVRIILTPGTILSGTMEIGHNLISSDNAGNDGILIDNVGGTGNTGLKINIHHNKIVGNPDDGIEILRLAGMTGDYFLSGNISHNLIQGNGDIGIIVEGPGQPAIVLDLTVDSNSVLTNGDGGIFFPLARGRLNVTNNFSGSNGDKGIFIQTTGSDNLVGRVNGNRVSNNGDNFSLEIESDSSSTMNIEFKNNVVTAPNEILFDVNNTSIIRAQVSGNDGNFSTEVSPGAEFILVP